MECKKFNGFKNQEQLNEITEKIQKVMEDILYITEICGFSVHLDGGGSIDIEFETKYDPNFTFDGEQSWYIIEMYADHFVEVRTNNKIISWDIVDLVATFREQLKNYEYDKYMVF